VVGEATDLLGRFLGNVGDDPDGGVEPVVAARPLVEHPVVVGAHDLDRVALVFVGY
jgi:hypothetical protein